MESSPHRAQMPQMRLEVVPVPVTDIDRARDFYAGQVGFNLDHDTPPVRACASSSSPRRGPAARS